MAVDGLKKILEVLKGSTTLGDTRRGKKPSAGIELPTLLDDTDAVVFRNKLERFLDDRNKGRASSAFDVPDKVAQRAERAAQNLAENDPSLATLSAQYQTALRYDSRARFQVSIDQSASGLSTFNGLVEKRKELDSLVADLRSSPKS